ncbi:MAG: hypothetical protein PVJ33_16405 [Lysobacterales bacterium]|jgi:hypothetical protein
MNPVIFAISAVLLFATSGLAASQDKVLVCHVGSKAGPNGETYLDDPDCVPGEDNDYFCPDAGKIDLIVVPEKAASSHLGDPGHEWDGIEDYEPLALGASGEGTEDADGDGIDEGCEPPSACPCWDAIELQQVTADNQDTDNSCSSGSTYPFLAVIQDTVGDGDSVEGGFSAGNAGANVFCSTRDTFQVLPVTADEANACIQQIADRCAAIGDPIN